MHHSALHSAINSALHSGMRGSPMFGGVSPIFSAITPNGDGTISVEPTKGTGSATFTRATTAYVLTTTDGTDRVYVQVSSGVARIQGARYSGGIFYWQLADGTPLHPVVTKQGANVFARYATRADSTPYSLGDRIIIVAGSGPAGGDGYWYQCTTAGTSAGSEPTFDTTIGNTTADNTVVWTNMGYYTVAGYLREPAGTNSLLQSRQFDTTWVATGTPSPTQNSTGIDGVSNKAWTLTDNDGAVIEDVHQSVVIANDSNTHCASIFILKDSDETRFPEVLFRVTGGTTQSIAFQINTKTGASTTRNSAGTVTGSVEDYGLWWRVVLTVANNSTGNTTSEFYIMPARGNTLGGNDVSATGSIVVDQTQLELNKSIPSSPIPTTTAAVTRNADVLSYAASGNLSDTAGTVFCSVRADDWANQAAADSIIGTDSTESLLRYSTNPAMEAFDGTNTVDGATDANITGSYQVPAYARWTGSTLQVGNNGASGTAGSYDGSWGATSITVMGGVQGCITDLLLYNKDLGQTKCESATTYD